MRLRPAKLPNNDELQYDFAPCCTLALSHPALYPVNFFHEFPFHAGLGIFMPLLCPVGTGKAHAMLRHKPRFPDVRTSINGYGVSQLEQLSTIYPWSRCFNLASALTTDNLKHLLRQILLKIVSSDEQKQVLGYILLLFVTGGNRHRHKNRGIIQILVKSRKRTQRLCLGEQKSRHSAPVWSQSPWLLFVLPIS